MQFLTTKEVCNLLQIHENTLYKWSKEGKFPKPFKIYGKNSKSRWLYSDIEQFIKESK